MSFDAFAIGTIAAAGIVIGIALVRHLRLAIHQRERLVTDGERAEGEVLQVWQDGNGSYGVTYRFQPRGAAQPVTRREHAGCLLVAIPEVGDRIGVRYDPDAPQRALMERGDGC